MFRQKALDLSHKAMDSYCYFNPPLVWLVAAGVAGFILGLTVALIAFKTMLNSKSQKKV